jgi:hypothetical protein
VSGPRVVIGAPLFEKARWLPEALDSLLAQTYRDFALLLIDDRSTDDTEAIARAAAARDSRVHLHVNERRLGMLGNTNRALSLARERFPDAELWALASDHDVWHPRFLEVMVGLLDAHPSAVLAFPLSRRIDEHGALYPNQKPPPRLDTRGIGDPRARVAHAFGRMAAGDMIYGLFRVAALPDRLYRPVLVPDRLLLTQLALRGDLVQADEVLWHRRFRGLADLERQRRAFFLDGVPRYAAWPWWLQHTLLLVGDALRTGSGPATPAWLPPLYLALSLRHRAWRRARRLRGRVLRARDALLGPPVRAMLAHPAARRLVRRRVLPLLVAVEEGLDRHSADPPPPVPAAPPGSRAGGV